MADRATGRLAPLRRNPGFALLFWATAGSAIGTYLAALALSLPGGGTVIDTPGVRSFGLGAVTVERVLAAFPDLAEGAAFCPPGCDHRDGTPGCALDGWVQSGHATAARLDSLRRLLDALTGTDD